MTGFSPRDLSRQPAFIDPGYRSTALRGPTQRPIPVPQGRGETSGPAYGARSVGPLDTDLTRNGTNGGEPIGERILVTGRVLDDAGRPVRSTVIEIWQANAAGRYIHKTDQHDAPLDPNFRGSGRCVTDADGRYRFLTVKPGAYPWRNHANAWRPNHIHFSLFGQGFASRLVTQMYFPGDPLLALDPIFNAVPVQSRDLLVSRFDITQTQPEWALAFSFDVILRGRDTTPME